MRYTPTRDCGARAARLQPFNNASDSFRGYPVTPSKWNNGVDYEVYSYRTLIAVHHPTLGWYIKPNVWSRTTARHLSSLHIGIGCYNTWRNKELEFDTGAAFLISA